MIHEAVLIREKASLNSKAEWRGYKVAKLEVEKPSWQRLKDLETDDFEDKNLKRELSVFREKILTHRADTSKVKSVTNPLTCPRKRRMPEVSKDSSTDSPAEKLVKFTGITLKKGKTWDPASSCFTKKMRLSQTQSPKLSPVGKTVKIEASPQPQVSTPAQAIQVSSDDQSPKSPVILSLGLQSTGSSVDALNEAVNDHTSGEIENTSVTENVDTSAAREPSTVNKLNTHSVVGDEDLSLESLKSELSGSSVLASLNDAVSTVEVDFMRIWWSKDRVNDALRDSVIGCGVKRAAVTQIGREPRKKLRELDVCDQFENLSIGMRLSSVSTVNLVARDPLSIDSITAELDSLALCCCQETSCMPYTIRNLGDMVENVLICEQPLNCEHFSGSNPSLLAKHVLCSSPKTPPIAVASGQCLISVNFQSHPLSSAADLNEPSCPDLPVSSLPAKPSPTTSGCFGLNLISSLYIDVF